ncbi:nucleoprotein TPR [Cryptococcus deuterogattii CA1014]|nr:nucleoprotein TPR [Cryptococcus deuterogattii CA1014]
MSEGGPHVDNPAQPEQSAQLPQQLAPQFATQEGETLPPTAPQTDITQAVPLPDDIRQQIEQEQALADAQKRVRELEEQVGKLSTEKEGVVGERDGAVAASNQLRTQLSNLKSSHHKTTSELSVLQTRLDSIEREKKELYEEAERLHQRSNKNIQELYALRSAKTDAAQKIAHLDVEVSELKMTTETAKFNEKRSIQALESARAEIISLSRAVSEVEERFGRYRAEAQSDQSKFRAENESLITRLSTLEQSHRSLQRAYNDQSSRLAEAHASIATLTSTAAANKAAVAVDVLAMEEANRLLERRLDEARSTVLEREAELENMASAHEEREKNWEAKVKKEEKMRKEVEKKMGELKKIADRLDMVEGRGGYISASAAVAGEMRKDGKSYTQLYTDFTIQESRLQAAEGEVERLTNLLDEISQELNEKKPILDEQAAEHARAIERANALASELASVISARDTLQNEVKSLQAASTHYTSEVSSLQSSVDDLSRQVKTLLRQIAINDDPSLASVAVDGDAEVGPTGDIITDHLVEFRSIRSLQEQNQRLLKITRSLMKKLDEREIARAEGEEEDEVTGRTLDEATEMIKKLHKDVLDAQKRVQDVTRERDLFSKLLARGEGLRWSVSASSGHPSVHGAQHGHGPLHEDTDTPSNQQLATLQADLDVFKEKAHGDLEEARKEIRKKMEEAAKADVERARAEAKVGLLEEQAKALTEASQQQKTEFAGLETQLRQLQAAVAQAHNEQRAALEQVAARQVESDRLRNEAAMLRAEKDQWKSVEVRLQSDFAQVQSERVKLQQLIDNLRNVANEAEKSRIEEREGLEKRIEEVQREATTLREQIEQARDAIREAEKKSQDFESRLEAATTSLRAEKEVASALAATRAEELAKVQADYEKAKTDSENRLRIGLNWKRRVDTLNEQIGNTAKAHLEAISEREKKVEEAEKKVKAAEEEVQTLKKKVEETEGTVQRLQIELANTQKSEGQAQGQAQADSTALSELQNEKNQLAEKLVQAEKELETLKATAAQEDKERDERYENNVARVNRVNAQMKARIDTLVQEKQTTQASVESLQAKISELEAKLTELESATNNTNAIAAASSDAALGPATEAAAVTRETKPSQEQINEAVNAAVAAREAELQSKFAKDLEEATTAAATAAAAAASTFAPQLTTAPAALAAPVIDTEATAKKAVELEATFENRVAEAVQTEKTALEEEIKQLKGQVEELKNKIKALERQVKTAEISRKTLERQKTEVEKKLGEATSAAAATAASAGSAGVTGEVKQVEELAQGAGAAKVTPTRGRGRGTATRGRGGATGRPNPVLSGE